jgi:hypothetical protein
MTTAGEVGMETTVLDETETRTIDPVFDAWDFDESEEPGSELLDTVVGPLADSRFII